jgi:hypothetical protein
MDNEQSEVEVEEIEPVEAVEPQEEISDILANELKEKAGIPEDSSQTEEDQTTEQGEKVNDKTVIETPYGEIVVSDAQKATFKSEKEFQAFLEKNPLLKEGFLRQSDYTRKTQEVAKERKAFLEAKKAFDDEQNSVWGQQKPSKDDMSFFKDFWHTFQYGSDDVAGKLSSFARDISLIAQGKQPVGPLANQDGTKVDYTRDSELIKTRRDIDDIRAEREREKQDAQQERQAQEAREAKTEVDSWLAEKQKQGIKISNDEFKTMALFSSLRDEQGNRLPLDEMYKLALAKLGKTEKQAIKKVFTDSKDRSNKTPSKPASRVPSNAKPDALSLDEILQEGQEQLAQG